MDPQDNTQNNQTDSLKQQYQDILDKYSKEIKPEPVTQVAPEPQAPVADIEPQPVSQDSVLPPLPQVQSENLLSEVAPEPSQDSLATIPQTPVTNGAIDEILNQPPQPPLETPDLAPPQTEVPPLPITPEPPLVNEYNPPTPEPPTPPAYTPPISPPPIQPSPVTPPQDVDAKLSEILDDKPEKPPSSSKFAKTFFFLSLIIFLAVVGAIAYNLIKDQSASSFPSDADKIVVDEDINEPSASACVINDQTYSINQSFTAADGCNTCTCQPDGTIACTELACELTPSESSPSSLPETGLEEE